MSFTRENVKSVSIDFTGQKTMTEQCHKDSCDMHVILKKFEKTGILEHVSKHAGTYNDYINAPDFREAMTLLAEAEQMFETVPAKIRKKFGNDPAEYLEFMQNPENYEAIKEMGLDPSHLPKPEIVVTATENNLENNENNA